MNELKNQIRAVINSSNETGDDYHTRQGLVQFVAWQFPMVPLGVVYEVVSEKWPASMA